MANSIRERQLKEAMAGPNEFCVLCYRDMGFSKQVHIDDPLRFKDGACYHEGSGQCCGPCEKELSRQELARG